MNGITPIGISGFGNRQEMRGAGLNLSVGEDGSNKASQAFGENLALRAKNQLEGAQRNASSTDETAPQQPEISEEKLDALANGLSSAIQYIKERHGEQAGTAVMGLVHQSLGDGEVTEESLGNALLEGIKFLDRNFGIAEGDAFMAELNDGGLNSAINEFFDNGLNERFIAITPQTAENLQASLGNTAVKLAEKYGESASAEITSIIDQLRESLEAGDFQNVKKGLTMADEALKKLEEQNGLSGLGNFSSLLSAPLSAKSSGTVDFKI